MGVGQTLINSNRTSRIQNTMPETRVPMTLRDHFLQDPFFKSAWEDMETFRGSFFKDSQSKKMIVSSEEREEKSDENDTRNRMFGRYLVPKKWMLPSLLDSEDLVKLSVSVADGQLVIEGKHLEKSEAGEVMVSRQFRRQYGLGPQFTLTEVVSNLSQDGVLVVTVPKEKRITELKEEKKLKMESKKSVEKKEESKSVQQINVENRASTKSTASTENKSKTASLVPMNLRESFFRDPFFKDNWLDIQQSLKNFFSKLDNRFSQQMKMLESRLNNNFGFSSMMGDLDKEFDLDLPELSLRDAVDLKVSDCPDKLELSLDTAGYKPDELKVTAGQGVVRVEGKHEERSESGEVMVS